MSVVLLYHRVAALEHDPYELAVHPARFTEHIAHLVALGRTAPLEEAIGRGGGGSVAITFDDGYADNAEVAGPLVSEAGLPATWFITADRLGQRRFWWDRLAEALLYEHPLLPSVDTEIAGHSMWLDLSSPAARVTALAFLHRRLRMLPTSLLEDQVDQLVGQLGAPAPAEDALTMTTGQLRELAARPRQEIGAHTLTHVQLQNQSEELQRLEVLGSVAKLTDLIGRPVRSFAYPYGSAGTVGRLAPRLAAEAGCALAVTTTSGPVQRRSDRYLLPRLTVGDWTGEEFAARLLQVLHPR